MRVGIFQIFVLAWSQYGLTLLIGEGKIRTLPVLVYAYLAEASPLYAATAAVILLAPPILLLGANWRALRARTVA
jgi:putative spermidine/putrescine transport system permease protein